MDLKKFASCLKKAISTKAAYAALDKGSGGTWTAGGCWTLAHAVAGLVDGTLVALVADLWGHSIVQHVVVMVGDKYLDADGLSTYHQLLHRWEVGEGLGRLRLVPFTPALQHSTMHKGHAVCDTGTVTAILPALMKCARRR
ncbi:MAG: hypothetical protein WC986_14755 [Elusimicrobiota bacterium]|jgi:hypothetical protein